MSAVQQLAAAADSCPQAAGRLSDGHPAGQTQAPQRLPDAGQHSGLVGLPQVLMGNVVYPPQLLAVIVPQLKELLGRSLRDDWGPGRRAGHSADIGTRFPPRSLRSGGFPFRTWFDWVWWCFLTLTDNCIIYYVNFNLNYMLGHDGPWVVLFLSMSTCQLLLHFVCLADWFLVLFPGDIPLIFKHFPFGLWGAAAVHFNEVKGQINLLFVNFNSWSVL